MSMMTMTTAVPSIYRASLGRTRIVRVNAEVEASERYHTVQSEAVALAAMLRTHPPRDPAAMDAVGHFQELASVTPVTKLYGGATFLALDFFLPEGEDLPPIWPGTRPGSWDPPAWTREVHTTTFVRRFPLWLLVVLGVTIVGGGIAVAAGIKDSEKRKAAA